MKGSLIIFGIRNRTGGGKVVLESIEQLFKNNKNTIILKPGYFGFLENIPLFIEFYFDNILKTSENHTILNLGDIPVRTKSKQIYYFDWMFLCLKNRYLIKFGYKRFFKSLIINCFAKYVTVCLAQTNSTKQALEKLKLFKEIIIGYTPIPIAISLKESSQFLIHKKIQQGFIYPSNYAKHKRFDRIIKFAISCPRQIIFLTLKENDFNKSGCRSYSNIINLGVLNHDLLISALHQSKGLIFPSSLESFGIPLVEAAVINKPIIYWGQDFVLDLVNNPTEKDEFINSGILKHTTLRRLVTEQLSNGNKFKKSIYESML